MKISLPSEFASLEKLVERLEPFLAERLGDEELAYRVLLLATEGVTNAIEHGNRLDAAKEVRVACRVEDDCVRLSIEDEGAGFDPSVVADPLDEANLLNAGGRGLYLMQEMADEVTFGAEGRRVDLRFDRRPGGDAGNPP